MRTEEKVIAALRGLSPERQAEVLDFAEFLKGRVPAATEPRPYGLCAGEIRVPDDFDAAVPTAESALPPTTLEEPGAPAAYRGSPPTLAEMREAIDREADRAKREV